jgi:hypothetical protein
MKKSSSVRPAAQGGCSKGNMSKIIAHHALFNVWVFPDIRTVSPEHGENDLFERSSSVVDHSVPLDLLPSPRCCSCPWVANTPDQFLEISDTRGSPISPFSQGCPRTSHSSYLLTSSHDRKIWELRTLSWTTRRLTPGLTLV